MPISKNKEIESLVASVNNFSKSLYSVCDVFFKIISWVFSLSLLTWIAQISHHLYEKVAFFIIIIAGILLLCAFLFIKTLLLLRYPLGKVYNKTGRSGAILFFLLIISPMCISLYAISYLLPRLITLIMLYQHPSISIHR